MHKLDRFASISEQKEGKWMRFRVATCCDCGYPAKLRENSNKPLPPEMLANKFRQWGWEIGNGVRNDRCPRCVAGKKPMSPQARRAAFCAINNVKRADAPVKLETAPTMPLAEPPPSPTMEDRRRIREALDSHYLDKKGCYSKNFSDKSLAASINVPLAWVSQLREAMGLGPDANEAAAQRSAELEALEKRLGAEEDRALKALDDLRKELNRIKIAQSYAA